MEDDVITFEGLKNKIIEYAPDADIELLRQAYVFSREAHCNQKRVAGTPFIGHPMAVASILADMHLDYKAVVAGLLHDTVEDAGITVDDIRDIFGDDVAFMVNALTKLEKIQFKTKEDAQAENFRKMFLAMSEDIRVILIKFADRLHNMRTLEYLPPDKQKLIAMETLEIFVPLANRMGIGWLRVEFEDISFKYLHSELFEELQRKVSQKRKDQEGYIKEVAKSVELRLREEGLAAKVSGRVKHYYGIYQKMQQRRISFEEVHDIFGLRVITDTKANCYIILGLIHSIWIPIPGRFKDYIAMPRSNMYQSLHTTVLGPKGERVEFQIRTEEMHLIAEEGIASHWLYKERSQVHDKDTQYITWMRELIHTQKEMKDPKEFVEMVKGEVFPDTVYVLTPAGDIKELPTGSTPVDFAYAIHTEVGNRCVGARVMGRIVPLRYKLQSGDTVEIINSTTSRPSKDWLNFVITHKARNRIKYWIKTEERKQSLDLGTKLFNSELRKNGFVSSIIKSPRMEEIAKEFNCATLDDLIGDIGYGRISPSQVVNKLKKSGEREDTVFSKITKTIIKSIKTHRGVRIKGVDNVMYNIANCCHPVPGDSLSGFITRGKGVTIHRRSCPNIQRVVDDSRIVEVSWESEEEIMSPARLCVETLDKPGMLATLSGVISSHNINLSHLEARTTKDKHAHFTFMLEVKDRYQLTNVSNKILSSDGVINVSR